MPRIKRHTFVLVALFVVAPLPVLGQGLWTEVSTLGYAGAALGLGIAACWSCDYQTAGITILVAGIGGAIIGNRIGGGAESAVRRGERPTTGQLWGARIGTVTGFAALGAGVAALLINETEGNAPAEDERKLAMLTVAGAGIGLLVEVLQERNLPPASTDTAVRFIARPSLGGGFSFGLSRSLP